MNILMISTYPPQECGIGTYTRDLVESLRERNHKVVVFSEKLFGIDYKDKRVIPVWNRKASLKLIRDVIKEMKTPDVIHFQNEFGLFPYHKDFINLANELNSLTRTVITWHTVLPDYNYNTSARSIVHSPSGSWFIRNSSIIPHGVTIRFPTRQEKIQAKKDLLLKSHIPTILLPGFITEGKKVLKNLQVLSKYDVQVILCGLCRDDIYLDGLKRFIEKSRINIVLDSRFIPEAKKDQYFKASDLVLLGREQRSPHSASGQVAQALGYGLPILGQNCPIHYDPGVIPYQNDLRDFLDHLTLDRLSYLSDYSKEVALERSWKIVADLHEKIYS